MDEDWKKKMSDFVKDATKGSLKEELGIPSGQKIPADVLSSAAKSGGKLAKRAQCALNMRKNQSSPWTSMGEKKSTKDTGTGGY